MIWWYGFCPLLSDDKEINATLAWNPIAKIEIELEFYVDWI